MEEYTIYRLDNSSNFLESIKSLIKIIASESDNFPFDSDDVIFNNNGFDYFLESLILKPNSVCFLAEHQNELVAIAYIEGGNNNRTYHLGNLGIGIKENHTNKGLGSLMLSTILNYAETTEFIAKINVTVKLENLAAIHLYKKYGFTCEGRSSRALFIDNNFYDILYFGKKID